MPRQAAILAGGSPDPNLRPQPRTPRSSVAGRARSPPSVAALRVSLAERGLFLPEDKGGLFPGMEQRDAG